MALSSRRTDEATVKGTGSFGMRKLLRLAAWGGMATAALVVVVIAQQSDVGSRRLATVLTGGSSPQQVAAAPTPPGFDARAETRRLTEHVRALDADRDRLLMRIATLERSLDDMTGSVSRLRSEAPPRPAPLIVAAPPPQPAPPVVSAPAVIPAPAPVQAAAPSAPRPAPASQVAAVVTADPAPAPAAIPAETVPVPIPRPDFTQSLDQAPTRVAVRDTRETSVAPTDLGVNLGRSSSVEGLRALWKSLHSAQEASFRGLTPLMIKRTVGTTGRTEYRLIVGPFTGTTAVSALCAEVAAAGRSCIPAKYDGEPL